MSLMDLVLKIVLLNHTKWHPLDLMNMSLVSKDINACCEHTWKNIDYQRRYWKTDMKCHVCEEEDATPLFNMCEGCFKTYDLAVTGKYAKRRYKLTTNDLKKVTSVLVTNEGKRFYDEWELSHIAMAKWGGPGELKRRYGLKLSKTGAQRRGVLARHGVKREDMSRFQWDICAAPYVKGNCTLGYVQDCMDRWKRFDELVEDMGVLKNGLIRDDMFQFRVDYVINGVADEIILAEMKALSLENTKKKQREDDIANLLFDDWGIEDLYGMCERSKDLYFGYVRDMLGGMLPLEGICTEIAKLEWLYSKTTYKKRYNRMLEQTRVECYQEHVVEIQNGNFANFKAAFHEKVAERDAALKQRMIDLYLKRGGALLSFMTTS